MDVTYEYIDVFNVTQKFVFYTVNNEKDEVCSGLRVEGLNFDIIFTL